MTADLPATIHMTRHPAPCPADTHPMPPTRPLTPTQHTTRPAPPTLTTTDPKPQGRTSMSSQSLQVRRSHCFGPAPSISAPAQTPAHRRLPGQHVQAQLAERIRPARPGNLRLPHGQQSPPRPTVPADHPAQRRRRRHRFPAASSDQSAPQFSDVPPTSPSSSHTSSDTAHPCRTGASTYPLAFACNPTSRTEATVRYVPGPGRPARERSVFGGCCVPGAAVFRWAPLGAARAANHFRSHLRLHRSTAPAVGGRCKSCSHVAARQRPSASPGPPVRTRRCH